MKRETKICKMRIMLLNEESDIKIRARLSIPERTYFRWKDIMLTKGHGILIQQKKPGPQPQISINQFIRKRTLSWRDRYGWGPCKIAGHLKAHHDVEISYHQIYKLLCETKRNKPIPKPRKTWGKKRF